MTRCYVIARYGDMVSAFANENQNPDNWVSLDPKYLMIDQLWRILCTHVSSEPYICNHDVNRTLRSPSYNIPKMTSALKLPLRLRAPISRATLSHPTSITTVRRTFAQKTSGPQGEKGSTKTGQQEADAHKSYPIPSNKAEPTLRDGEASPMADEDGTLRDDLPQDVKKHNQEMEERYDRPYNQMAEEGKVEPGWKR